MVQLKQLLIGTLATLAVAAPTASRQAPTASPFDKEQVYDQVFSTVASAIAEDHPTEIWLSQGEAAPGAVNVSADQHRYSLGELIEDVLDGALDTVAELVKDAAGRLVEDTTALDGALDTVTDLMKDTTGSLVDDVTDRLCHPGGDAGVIC